MTCPFLKEAEVAYCQSATVRTMIPLAQVSVAQEKCGSPEHATCTLYRAQAESPSEICPNLRHSLMQYCAAAPVTKFIPYSESLLSRCGNESHRYCETYLKMAHPGAAGPAEDLPAPAWLQYSANHMWLDLSGGSTCHAGIDSFLGRVLGAVDAITYVPPRGEQRPAVVLTVGGIDLELVFPNPFRVTACNPSLHTNPARLTAEPYTGGWLFEGTPGSQTARGLRPGADAGGWMQEEARRLNQYLQDSIGVAADGGLFERQLARHLPRASMLALFHEFFSPFAREES